MNTTPANQTLWLMAVPTNVVPVIKAIRELTGLGIKESKSIIDNVPSILMEFVSEETANEALKLLRQVACTAEMRRDSLGSAKKEQTEWKVRLLKTGPQKVLVIKAIREATGLNMRECMKLADNPPCLIADAVPIETAKARLQLLENAGATVIME